MRYKLVFAHPKYEPIVLPEQTRVTLDQLESIDDGSCPEIILSDTLDYVENRDEVLQSIVKKLQYGGIIVINGVDLNLSAKAIVTGRLNLQDARDLMYNKKLSVDTLENILNNLSYLGLETKKCKIQGYFYSVTAKRPEPATN